MHNRIERPLTKLVLGSLGLVILGLGGVIGSHELFGMVERISVLEARLAEVPVQRRALESELEDVRLELSAVRAELDQASSAAESAADLSQRLSGAETRLVDIAGAIEAHGSSLMVLKEANSTLAPTLEERLATQEEEVSAMWEGLSDRVDATELLAESS